MKYIAAGLVIMIGASCEKVQETTVENETKEIAYDGYGVPMSFKAKGQEVMKSDIDVGASAIVWDSDDAIAIYDGSELREFSVSSRSNGNKIATFSGSAADVSTYYSVTPYSAATLDTDIKVTIPATQTVIGDHCVDGEALVATATVAAGDDISFTNQFSLLKISLSGSDIVSVTLTGKSDEAICGEKVLSTSDGTFSGTPEGKTINLVYKASKEGVYGAFPAGDYFVVLWPGEFTGGFKLIMTKSDGSKAIKSTSASVTFTLNSGANASTIDDVTTWVPNTITTANQLKMWRRVAEYYTEGEEVKLGADIDLGGYAWTPVPSFFGVFDGQNHKIYNFTVANASDNRIGFIRTLGSSSGEEAILRNVVFGSSDGAVADGTSSITLSIESSGSWSYAGVVGYAQKNSRVYNVTNFIPVSASGDVTTKHAVAGIVGAAGENATIESCVNNAAITSSASCTSTDDSAIGGVLAATGNANVKVISCTNNAIIQNNCVGVSCMGGIVGKSTGTGMLVDECSNTGEIKNNAACVGSTEGNWDISIGGVVGFMGNTTTVNKCSNSGRLYNGVATNSNYDYCFGGVVGATTKSGCVIKGCNNTAEMMYADKTEFKSYLAAGGILGYSRGTITITKADDGTRTTNSGQFFQRRNHTQHLYIGGIAGLIEKQESSVIEFCTNEGRIVGSDPQTTDKRNFYAGGICGSASTGIIRDCINNGFLIARDANLIAWFGGIVGGKDKYPTSVLRCVNNGAVSGYSSSGSSSIGGILGVLQPDQTEVRDCINSGLITTANIYTNASGNTSGEPVSYQNKDYYKGGLFGYVNAPKANDVTDNVTGCIINCTMSNQTVDKDNYTGIVAGQVKSTGSTAYKLVFGTISNPVLIVNTSKFEYGSASNPATITPGDVMNTDANVKKWLMGSTSSLYNSANGSSNTDIVDFNYVIATPAQAGIE